MTKEHSTLTGSSLHEPKGVAAASANRVYVSDGLGSGSWTTVSPSVLATASKVFEAQLFHVREEQTSGTAAGTFTSGSWVTRTLNTTKTNEITSASLASNQISLPAGTYFIEATAPAAFVGQHKAKLYNVTDASDIIIGTTAYGYRETDTGTGVTQTDSLVKGRFTLSGTKTLELRHRCAATAVNGLGTPSAFSVVEVYSEVMIWKVA